jgi:hypothetical protein
MNGLSLPYEIAFSRILADIGSDAAMVCDHRHMTASMTLEFESLTPHDHPMGNSTASLQICNHVDRYLVPNGPRNQGGEKL